MLITVAIPCYNSSKTLPLVVKDIENVFESNPEYDYRIVLVNDNSPDNTYAVIRELCDKNPKITGVDLSKNYGQVSAQMAAIKYIEGDIAVFMDDDGQHSPYDIPLLIEEIKKGNDLVFACFKNKKHNLFKRITSRLNAKLLELTNRKPVGINISSFFAISKTAIDSLKNYKSPFPSMCGYLLQITNRISNVELEHRKRLSGRSNYTFSKLLKLFLQGFTNFSIAPLRLSSVIGTVSALIGFGVGIYYIIKKFVVPGTVGGFTANISATLFVGGLIMLMFGMIGEYIGRIYILLSDMPQYNIRETYKKEEDYGTEEK